MLAFPDCKSKRSKGQQQSSENGVIPATSWVYTAIESLWKKTWFIHVCFFSIVFYVWLCVCVCVLCPTVLYVNIFTFVSGYVYPFSVCVCEREIERENIQLLHASSWAPIVKVCSEIRWLEHGRCALNQTPSTCVLSLIKSSLHCQTSRFE